MVIVIDETFAHKYFPNEDPLGKRINMMLLGQAEIVGVVGHIKQWGLDSDAQQSIQAQFYMPILQTPDKFMPLLANGLTQMVAHAGNTARPHCRDPADARRNEQPASDVWRGHDGRGHRGFPGAAAIFDDPAGDFRACWRWCFRGRNLRSDFLPRGPEDA